MDASSDTLSKVLGYEIEESNEIILGFKCKKLTIESQLGTSVYFFSDKYLVNPDDFKDHRLNFWNFYTAKTKAIPLKIILENEAMTLISTAIMIDQSKLQDSTFVVPTGYLKKKF